MARENPILPSEPLSLEPNLIAAAVIAEELDNQATNGHQDNVPRNASKVRRRLDNRHYGRSESRGRSEDREHKERHSEEHYSPRRTEVRGYHRSSEDHDSKRYRITGQAAAEESGQSYYTNRRSSRDEQKKGTTQPTTVLGIFGMSKFTNEDALHDLFERYGPVTKVQIIRDQHMGHSRGYAFVNMANVSDAQRARDSLNDTVVHDRRVRVDYSFTSRPHSPTPGKYRGQDTSRRYAPYHPRRRANSRDRRRREQERHYAPSRGRSKSPGWYRREPSPASYQPPPMSARSHRSSNYVGGREYGHSRSPPRRSGHPDYHGRSDSRNRYLRNDYRHDRPSY